METLNRRTKEMSALLLLLVIMAFSNVQTIEATGTIYIRADGSVEPSTAPIQRSGNVYTLTSNITSDANGIIVQSDGIIIDGAGCCLEGKGTGNFSGIFLSNRSNVVIKNFEVKAFDFGIELDNSSYNRICENDTIVNVQHGIHLRLSSNNIIIRNNATDNGQDGINLDTSTYNNIIANDGSRNGRYGIYCRQSSNNNNINGNKLVGNILSDIAFYLSSYNNIYRNSMTNSYDGLFFRKSSYNIVYENDVTGNQAGIDLSEASNNTFYHNNIINNPLQVYDISWDYPTYSPSKNIFDNGYCSGGNYWSDYAGRDNNLDGIGDSPYIIDVNNADRYPLMNQWLQPKTSKLVPILSTFTTVMEPNTMWWDKRGIISPFVLYDNCIYKMWYSANPPLEYGPGVPKVIAYAESADGIIWTNRTVVHNYGLQGYYLLTGYPYVIKEGGNYRMWHMDYPETVAGDLSNYISHISSVDGLNWINETKVLSALGQSNPQGDGFALSEPCVLSEPNIGYTMWYSVGDHYGPGMGGPPKIWRATSNNGLIWSNRQLSLPYISNTWEGNVGHPSVVKEDDGTYTIFYGAIDTNGISSIGIAESVNGISWTNRKQLLRPSDLDPNITSVGAPFHFQDVDGVRYLYFEYYNKSDEKGRFGRIQLGTQQPSVEILYGSTLNLIIIDTKTGAGSIVGPFGTQYSVWGLEYDTKRDTLYGVTNDAVNVYGNSRLLKINRATGAATPIGGLVGRRVDSLAYDSINDKLYGMECLGNNLVAINTSTGVGTVIGSTGTPIMQGLAFNPVDGKLYSTASSKLFTINPSTGNATAVASIDSSKSDIRGLSFDRCGTLYGVYTQSGGLSRLITIDTSTGQITDVGPTGYYEVQGLAFARVE